MIDDRNIIHCDCCARQILERVCNDKYCIGPQSKARCIGVNLHCCGACWPDYKNWEEMDRFKNGWMF